MCKKIILAVVITCFVFSVSVAASDTFTQSAEGYFYCNTKGVNNGLDFPTYYGEGDTVEFSGVYGTERRFGYIVKTDIQAGCTYTVTFKISYENVSLLSRIEDVTFVGLTFNDHLPSWVDMLPQYNSASVDYSGFSDFSYVINTDDNYDLVTFAFCTAQGYIDNLEWGELYAAFDFLGELVTLGKPVIDAIYVDCVADPSAEYFQRLALGQLTDAADNLEKASNALQDKEKEIMDKASGIYDSVSSDFHNYLADAKSFMSAATRSAASLGSAANVLTASIYDPIMSSLPAEVAVLFSVVPMLAFVAWLFGFGGRL